MHVGNKGVVCARTVRLVKVVVGPVNRPIEQSWVPAVVLWRATVAELTVSNQAVHEPLVVRAKSLLNQFFDRQGLNCPQSVSKTSQVSHLIALDGCHRDG